MKRTIITAALIASFNISTVYGTDTMEQSATADATTAIAMTHEEVIVDLTRNVEIMVATPAISDATLGVQQPETLVADHVAVETDSDI